jgi:hypothetical protein
LGGNAFHLAVDSFVPGMRAALLVAGILMLMAAAGAFLALRSPRHVAAPAADEALPRQPILAKYDEAR